MAYYLAITIGMILFLGMLGGSFVYFLKSALNSKDSSKVDSLEKSQDV